MLLDNYPVDLVIFSFPNEISRKPGKVANKLKKKKSANQLKYRFYFTQQAAIIMIICDNKAVNLFQLKLV